MPPRVTPTVRQARLGAELRILRERAGRTAREAGALLGVDQARMSNIEAGRIGIGEDRIRRLAAFYACGDRALIDALCVIANERRGQHWWEEYRGVLPPGFLDVAELEHHATYLRSLQIVSIPGILQTEEYARTIFGGDVPALSDTELEARVEHRMRRRLIFERPDPPELTALIHEAALRMRFGGRRVAGAQLAYVLEVSEAPSVTVRVIPFRNEEFFEATQPLLYAGGAVPQLDTVQMDTIFGGHYLYAEAQLNKYRALLDIAEVASLGIEDSRDLIQRIIRER
ncbi:helix-turn-helix domain-containing protein [Streptomyces sp. WAC 00631]|uniref:helix-turn-helix domain-containing protein n=1 Tax=Streptomyces sp. WAC 00631 TaxID=2203201 RepID=UPI000F776429|nr:helix-turn-helix transcriptional regulator [Streptomyces sp. WAC 00631]MCC5033375.1 helix-turn-helix domain-containing protein [Streptomyces sp. WAC 00631]